MGRSLKPDAESYPLKGSGVALKGDEDGNLQPSSRIKTQILDYYDVGAR